jgi:hypothetical protein
MEAEPTVSDWIKLEDEVEAQRARASLIRRVSSARDQPMLNLTEASAYDPFLCLPSLPSPVSHAGKNTFGYVQAPTPTHIDLVGLFEDPSDEMDCGEDDGSGVDGMANPPSSLYNTLFTQHIERAVREPHLQSVAAADPTVTEMLIGDQVQP